MSNADYILATKHITAFRKLEAIANNVANANTNGFRAQDVEFASYMNKDKYDNTAFAKIKSSITDFSTGALKKTGNPLDVAINGDGYFTVRTPHGDMLTRDGAFTLSGDGTLVNSSGYPVLTVDMQTIVFEETDTNPIIRSDGTIYVGAQERGVLGVANVADANKNLKRVGDNLWKSENAPENMENPTVIQGFVENSNVNSIKEIASLAELQREVANVSQLINENMALTRNAIKSYSRG